MHARARHGQVMREVSSAPKVTSEMPPLGTSDERVHKKIPTNTTGNSPAETLETKPSGRWLALDLFRFLAVVLMIQGHVFFEVAGPTVRNASWYGLHGYIHGFTAPIFLFSSGIAFGITTLRKWNLHTFFGPTVFKRLERYAILILLGYALHMSQLSLSWLSSLPADRLARVTRIDALQNIGMALLVSELLVVLFKKRALFIATIAALLLACVLLGPTLWEMELPLPIPVAAWFTSATHSIFPLVPWSAFLFAGILTAWAVQGRFNGVDTSIRGLRTLFVPLAIASATCVIAGDRLAHSGFDPFPEHNFWKVSPYFFLIRLGAVLGVLAFFSLVEWAIVRRRELASQRAQLEPARQLESTKPNAHKQGRIVTMIQTIGQQTLVLYVAHLLLLYGTGITPGFARFRRSLDLGQSIAVVLFFFVTMGLLAHFWARIKRSYPKRFDQVRLAATFGLIALFLFS